VSGRDGRTDRPDSLSDFPEEFEQHPDAQPRDQARRAKPDARASEETLAKIEAMKRKVADLARGEREEEAES
jgi:hypothetical protein